MTSNKVKIFNYGIGEKISDGFINQTLNLLHQQLMR